MEKRSNYVVIEEDFIGQEPLIIKDIGPWDKYLSVTNNAEDVVLELIKSGRLGPNQRLLYYDSDGQLDEIVVTDGRFTGFKPGARK